MINLKNGTGNDDDLSVVDAKDDDCEWFVLMIMTI